MEDWGFDDADSPDVNAKDGLKDLNKLGDGELKRYKEAMDVQFNENNVQPGDAGFVYDKRIDFEAAEKDSNSWDDDEEEEDMNDYDFNF